MTVSPTRLVNINIIQLLANLALAAAKITVLHTALRQAFVRQSNGGFVISHKNSSVDRARIQEYPTQLLQLLVRIKQSFN
jgi:hypothetical protein